MKEGIRWLYENVDDEYANDIVRRNAEKLLGVDKLSVVSYGLSENRDVQQCGTFSYKEKIT